MLWMPICEDSVTDTERGREEAEFQIGRGMKTFISKTGQQQ
jgi:hypothetical protein